MKCQIFLATESYWVRHVNKGKFATFLCMFLLFTLLPGKGMCQTENDEDDEISVTLSVDRLGLTEIPVIIKNQVAYLPVKEVFDFLKIKNTSTEDFGLVSGFFINRDAGYVLDRSANTIIYLQKKYTLQPGELIKTPTNLYVAPNVFERVFGLNFLFYFRTLTVILNTKLNLPAIREMEQQSMRKTIENYGEKKADTTYERNYTMLHVGVADWFVSSTSDTKGKTNTRANLTLGGVLGEGEANVYFNYASDNTKKKFNSFYQWRRVDNDNKYLRQVSVGKVFAQATSRVFAPISGFQLTNTPTTFRRSFGAYRISDRTGPNWTVELYINNALVRYVRTDASGFYSFDVPLVYGNSEVKLRFYGPFGEEEQKEQFVRIPFDFLPAKRFEYSFTSGIVETEVKDPQSFFSRLNANYGVNKHITIGAGAENLTDKTTEKTLKFVNTSFRLGSHLVFNGDHLFGVRSKGLVSYRLPSSLQIDYSFIKYQKDQTIINTNFLQEQKASFFIPFHQKKINFFSLLTLNKFTLPTAQFTTGEYQLSSFFSGINANFTTSAGFENRVNKYAFSTLSLTFNNKRRIRITPLLKYDYRLHEVNTVKLDAEKTLKHQGLMNFSFEKNFNGNVWLLSLGLRYNFNFAQVFFSTRQSNYSNIISQSAGGSLIYDSKAKFFGINNEFSVTKGGVIIRPFLDLNCNGIREGFEPGVFGLNLYINGGRLTKNLRDSTISILSLEAYTKYNIEFDKNSFENIAWQIKKKNISLVVDPNDLKQIEVPVAVFGEVSGNVYKKNPEGNEGIGRIVVNIYDSTSQLFTHVLTDVDGYFDFLGLPPGSYTAQIDSAQLRTLKLTATPEAIPFRIIINQEGDIVDWLEFKLSPILRPGTKPQPLNE